MRKPDPLPRERHGFCCGCRNFFGLIFLIAPWRYRCAECAKRELGILVLLLLVAWAPPALAADLHVNLPVAALQCDLDTTAETLTLDPPSTDKVIASMRQMGGLLRIVVYGLNQKTFVGKFATTPQAILRITNVRTTTPEGTDAGATISVMPPPATPANLRTE